MRMTLSAQHVRSWLQGAVRIPEVAPPRWQREPVFRYTHEAPKEFGAANLVALVARGFVKEFVDVTLRQGTLRYAIRSAEMTETDTTIIVTIAILLLK